MNTQTQPSPAAIRLAGALDAQQLAVIFHNIYERLAPDFGYETRTETRNFDPTTPNGKLMIAVCAEVIAHHLAKPADPAKPDAEVTLIETIQCPKCQGDGESPSGVHASRCPECGGAGRIKQRLSPIAPGHNPDKLTVSQVGEGWRLLDGDEIKSRRIDTLKIERWFLGRWDEGVECSGVSNMVTYRTRLSRAELAALDAPPWTMPKAPEGHEWHRTDFTADMLPAPRVEPVTLRWDHKTLPPLPLEIRGKVGTHRNVIVFANANHVVVTGYMRFYELTYEVLLRDYTLPNGSPCGTKPQP